MKLDAIRPSVWDVVLEVMEENLKDSDFEAREVETDWLIDWRKGANSHKLDRELYEQYGVFKDVILDARFQYFKTLILDNMEFNFDVLLGDPVMPLATCIIVLFLMHKRVSNDLLGLSGAFLFNVNPLYVIIGYLIYKLSNISNRKSKPYQYISPERQAAAAKAASEEGVQYDHVLVGGDIGTLYTAAILARNGHRCCVLQPKGFQPLEIRPSSSSSRGGKSSSSTPGSSDELPNMPIRNLCTGKIERYQSLFDMVALSGTPRLSFAPLGTAESGYTYAVLKMRKKVANVKKDLWTLGPGDFTLAADTAIKLVVDKVKLESFVQAVLAAHDLLVQFLNSRAVPIGETLEVARGDGAKQIFSLSTEAISDIYRNFSLPQASAAGPSPPIDASADATGEDEVDSISMLLDRVSIFGSDELAMAPSECSGLGLSQALTTCAQGAFYPVGGPAAIERYLVSIIENAGGSIVYGADVSSVIVDRAGDDTNGDITRASGVLLADKTAYHACRSVISGIGLLSTYSDLIPEDILSSLSPNPFDALEGLVEAAPKASVLFWLKGSVEDNGLSSADFVDFGGSKMGAVSRVWSPSAKDLSWAQRHPTVQAVVVEVPDMEYNLRPIGKTASGGAGPSIFVPTSSSRTGNTRSYVDAARHILEEVYPKAAANIIHEQQEGSLCSGKNGLSFTKKKFSSAISSVSPIPGLFFCGKDLGTSGLAGEMQGAYVAACAVLGYSRLDLALGRNAAVDIQNLVV